MKKTVTVVASAASLLMPLAIGLASPAAAATTPMAMPDVRGMSLQKANETVAALSPETEFRLTSFTIDGMTQRQLSPASWVVCRQSPSPSARITTTSRINLGVARPWNGC